MVVVLILLARVTERIRAAQGWAWQMKAVKEDEVAAGGHGSKRKKGEVSFKCPDGGLGRPVRSILSKPNWLSKS